MQHRRQRAGDRDAGQQRVAAAARCAMHLLARLRVVGGDAEEVLPQVLDAGLGAAAARRIACVAPCRAGAGP